MQKEKEGLGAGPPPNALACNDEKKAEKETSGLVARTRPLAEPLSPRGPQPVPRRLRHLY